MNVDLRHDAICQAACRKSLNARASNDGFQVQDFSNGGVRIVTQNTNAPKKSKFPHTPVRPLKLEVLEKQTKASASTATTSASPKIVTLLCVALPANPFPVKCYTPLYGPLPCVTILENLKARWLPSLILRQGVHRREPREYDTSNVPQELIHPNLFTSITRKSKEGPDFPELR